MLTIESLDPEVVSMGTTHTEIFWFFTQFRIEMENYFLAQENKRVSGEKYIFNRICILKWHENTLALRINKKRLKINKIKNLNH